MKSGNEHKRVLLISNSTLFGSGYLDHAENEIRSLLGNVKSVLFVPFALHDRDAYASAARERYQKMGYGLESIHTAPDAQHAVNNAEAIFIGGGNTFRLLKALYDMDVSDLEAAVRQSDICITCTPSKQTFLKKDFVAPGTFIAAVGADSSEKQELEPAVT